MRKQLAVHVWLLRANGVHPVSDGTGGTYLLLLEKKGRVERDLGARKAEAFCSRPVSYTALLWCGQQSKKSQFGQLQSIWGKFAPPCFCTEIA